MGWYLAGSRLAGYIANDTKYRYLRLDTAQKGLQFYLYHIDSFYATYPDLRKKMLQTEEQHRINFERLQRAERLKAEAKDLEKSVRKR